MFERIGFSGVEVGWHECEGCECLIRWMKRLEGAPQYSDELQAVVIDGDFHNHSEDNLVAMCPDCSKAS